MLLSGEEIARVADLFGQQVPRALAGQHDEHLVLPRRADRPRVHRQLGLRRATREGTFGAEFHKRARLQRARPTCRRAGRQRRRRRSRRSRADAGEVIVREGGPADKFFIVVEGEVEVVRGRGRAVRDARARRLLRRDGDHARHAARRDGARHGGGDAALDGPRHVPRRWSPSRSARRRTSTG